MPALQNDTRENYLQMVGVAQSGAQIGGYERGFFIFPYILERPLKHCIHPPPHNYARIRKIISLQRNKFDQ